MSRLPPRTRTQPEPRGSWVWSFLQALALVVVAYLVAVFLFTALVRVSELPHGPLWDDSFRAPLAFVLIMGATILLLLPYFDRENDRGLRTFSIMSALFLLAFASLSTTGIADPKLPLTFLDTYVVQPLRHRFGF